MARRNKPTSDAELQDAIDRIGKKPEAKHNIKNSRAWKDYLVNILDINPQAVNSSKGKDFWKNVRLGITEEMQTKPNRQPTERDLAEANVEEVISYRSNATGRFVRFTLPEVTRRNTTSQVSYRNKETGRFIKL
jgi:hypothetical protein